MKLTAASILAWRLRRQLLDPRAPVDAPAVVRRLCGVQAQVASAAALAVASARPIRSPARSSGPWPSGG